MAYQGLPLACANFERLNLRGRICAFQQSAIFIRVCIARLLNEPRRALWAERLAALPAVGTAARAAFELAFRRSHICLGHNQFTRLDALQSIGGFPISGTTEDSTLGYALGERGWIIEPSPMIELVDLPETPDKVMRQSARWYLGALDDVRFLWSAWRRRPTAYNFAQFLRHLVYRAIEWPTAMLAYPALGWLGWHLAWSRPHHPVLLWLAVAAPVASIGLTFWFGGWFIPRTMQAFSPHLPVPVDLRFRGPIERVVQFFRSQAYWTLSSRGTWRVLAAAAIGRRYAAAKTDRVRERAPRAPQAAVPGIAG